MTELILFLAFALLLLATRHVLSREAWWCANVRGRALLLAGWAGLLIVIIGGVMWKH